ncbi:MAG TPA: hypothetical protein VE990_12415 [Acidimicrobiales bacterium]|nr:hypothetical protein [Acidimicrobiales bacterium]
MGAFDFLGEAPGPAQEPTKAASQPLVVERWALVRADLELEPEAADAYIAALPAGTPALLWPCNGHQHVAILDVAEGMVPEDVALTHVVQSALFAGARLLQREDDGA